MSSYNLSLLHLVHVWNVLIFFFLRNNPDDSWGSGSFYKPRWCLHVIHLWIMSLDLVWIGTCIKPFVLGTGYQLSIHLNQCPIWKHIHNSQTDCRRKTNILEVFGGSSVLQIEQPPPGLPAGSPSLSEKSGRSLLQFTMARNNPPKNHSRCLIIRDLK